MVTSKGKTIYVHILKNVSGDYIFLPGLTASVRSANLFNNGNKVRFKQQPEGVFVYLDNIALDDIDTIIRLEMQ